MKLIITHYLASLRERGELDAILPDILSELGFDVLSRPQTGTRQAGVDVAAVGPDPDNEDRRTLFLFTIKSGNLTRSEWDSGPQAVRQSINDILDNYLPHRVAEQYAALPVAICLCIGGEMREQVNETWEGFTGRHTTETIRFRLWNGEHLARYLLDGVLRQEFVDGSHRSSFQKALAMLDQPDVAYRHFRHLLDALLAETDDPRQRTRQLRQAYICAWILFVWAREAGNLDAAWRISDLLLIRAWPSCDPTRNDEAPLRKERLTIYDYILRLNVVVGEALLFGKIAPFADKELALSLTVDGRNGVEVNLALFETLGRIAIHGLWMDTIGQKASDEAIHTASFQRRDEVLNLVIATLNNNPTLLSPGRDDFAIEIALVMILAQRCGRVGDVAQYLFGLSERLRYTLVRRSHYPVASTEYRELLRRTEWHDDDTFEEGTRGSVLYPLLMTWLSMLGNREQYDALAEVLSRQVPHTTHQIWLPDDGTDATIWYGDLNHGVAVPGIPLHEGTESLEAVLQQACEDHPALNAMGAIRSGFDVVLLAALRHHRLPVPPAMWFLPPVPDAASDAESQSDMDPAS